MSLMQRHSNPATAEQYSSPLACGVPPQVNIPRNEGLTHNGWNHQVPTHMPWSGPTSNTLRVVRFEGDSLGPNAYNPQLLSPSSWWQVTPQVDYTDSTVFSSVAGSQKRKLNIFTDGPSTKQLITEEKMAAELDRLHITTPAGEKNPVDVIPHSENRHNTVSGRLPTLVISEELKKLQEEPIIPASLLQSWNKPTMAVVLWKPPGGSLRDVINNTAEDMTDENDTEEEKEPQLLQERMDEDPDSLDMENNNSVSYVNHELDL